MRGHFGFLQSWMSLVFFVALVGVGCRNQLLEDGHEVGEKIPPVQLQLLDSVSYRSVDRIADGKPLVVLFFDPYCEFCQAEITGVINNIKSLSNIGICMVSAAPLSDLRSFAEKYQLEKYSNMVIGRDTGRTYVSYFNVRKVPHTTVYSKDRKLLKIFNSKIGFQDILANVEM